MRQKSNLKKNSKEQAFSEDSSKGTNILDNGILDDDDYQ